MTEYIITEFGILLGLLFLNAFIGYFEESKAENALEALKNNLATIAKVIRNSTLSEIPIRELVPGDVLVLRIGDIVPSDCRLLGIGTSGEVMEGDLMVDQAALTGESLPVNRNKGQVVYSTSIIKQGQMLAVVVKTGLNTFIGRAAHLISNTHEQGQFQKVIGTIGNYLIFISVFFVLLILVIRVGAQNKGWLITLREVTVLLIAAIPVGLPTVLSTTMALGAKQLAAKKTIVKRLPAIEEFASVRILCSDKTGTLTLNELTLDEPYLVPGKTEPELVMNAFFASEPGANDAIESAVRQAAMKLVPELANAASNQGLPGYTIVKFIPFNPVTKYTEAHVFHQATNTTFRCMKGAPHVILEVCGGHPEAEEKVLEFASKGLRALGVARGQGNEPMQLVGLISLLDPPRPDSAQTIQHCEAMGVNVKMITGDQVIIGKEVAKRLQMGRCILNAKALVDSKVSEEELIRRCEKSDGFGQVIPEHKYRVVELLQKKGYIVAMTGDGVNDAPALKKANVGIAVHPCTDAARSASDIVLMSAGLSTIVDGIKCSRAIFQRMRSYAVYRITSTLHFLIFFFLAIVIYDFELPHLLILFITVLNDLATMVIAVDNAMISPKPDKWRLGQLLTLCTILALFITLFSFGHFWVTTYYADFNADQVRTAMYLQISSCPHFVIFSTRVGTYFWKSPPSLLFFSAIMGTQLFAMIMSIVGWPAMGAEAIGVAWGFGIMGVSLLSTFFLDLVKVMVFRNWSFQLTAKLVPTPQRTKKLRMLQTQAIVLTRTRRRWKLIQKQMSFYAALVQFKKGIKVNSQIKEPASL
ncbi:hypothetical protein HMI54_002547 [Coelomomyces lativittatus]|nr:hypothetical protein HMI54_002547 [Coelomomyces lativittatus]